MHFADVEIPDELLQAQRDGNLVVFAGAGVSIPSPSSLPTFEDLVRDLAVSSGVEPHRNEPPEVYLGRLARTTQYPVDREVANIVGQSASKPSDLHSEIIHLFPEASDVRIITTNFDDHLSSAAFARWPEGVPEFTAPALPPGDTFSGIVYVHGRVGDPRSSLVVTDEDFGIAYLTRGYARRFLVELFQHNHVLFVGYSHSDTVLTYLARGLPFGTPTRYALAQESSVDTWNALGVQPIVYPSREPQHEPLVEAFAAWGRYVALGLADHEREIATLVADGPDALDPQSSDYLQSRIEEQVDAVTNGEADYTFDYVPSRYVEDLRIRFAGQVHFFPEFASFYLSLNTALPPFNKVDVRRALNFAVNRELIVELLGGSGAQSLTCQILPPNFPGYEPYCPYTIDPGPGGLWTGPDVETAKRLVQRSGTAGTRVTYWYTPALGGGTVAAAHYFVKLLDKIGFVADLVDTPPHTLNAYWQVINDSGQGIQIAPTGWLADYPAASNFITTQLTCDSFHPNNPVQNVNTSAFCDKDIDAMIQQALQLQTEDQAAAGEAWAKVDRSITDLSPYVDLMNSVGVDLLSDRLENYQRNPQWGLLLAQVWVR